MEEKRREGHEPAQEEKEAGSAADVAEQLVLPGIFPAEGGKKRKGRKERAERGSGLYAGTINYIGRNTPGYPARFEGLTGMPEGLYCLGSLPEEDEPTVGIVGARLCSHYGHRVAYEFGKYLAERGIQVISGLALGIDGYAQEGALAGGGRTFAVMGCGVDVCYPRSNKALYEKIAVRGGIISEEEPGTPPLAYNFPKRNRIISALSDLVVVVEAREKSGSLITVDFALEQGRSVLAVPGRVGDALSDGCNFLIAQGAGIAWSAEAVLEEIRTVVSQSDSARQRRAEQARLLKEAAARARETTPASGGGKHARAEKDPMLSRQGKRAFAVISGDPAGIDEIAARAGMTAGEVMTAMVELQMLEYVEEVGHQRYVEKNG